MVTDEDNATIERMIEEGKSAIAIRAAVPDVSRTNVYLKIAKFKKHGTVGRVQTKTLGRPRVMNEGIDKFLQGLLAAKPDMELEEMRRHMQDQLHLTVSMSTISRAITRAGIASGRLTNRARNSSRRKNKTPATTEPVEGEEEEGSPHPNQASEQSATNLGGSVNNEIWGPTQSDTSLSGQQQQRSPNQSLLQPPQQAQQTQQQHALMHVAPSQQHVPQPQQPQSEMHVLDPSLAQTYPIPTPYHSVYPDLTGGTAHAGVGNAVSAVLPSSMDVYRSPYAPIQPDTHLAFP